MKFSIVATDYEGVVSLDVLQRFIDSLNAQVFKDFEVIIVHDGQRLVDINGINVGDLNIRFIESGFRTNAWGHPLRTIGMKESKGEFIINTNTDNYYYPDALFLLSKFIDEHPDCKVFISLVKMMGLYTVNEYVGEGLVERRLMYDNPRDYSKFFILTGDPPVFGNIDLMSLVAHRSVWEDIGYWYDISQASDAVIYGRICELYQYRYTGVLLGEHY